MSIYIRQWYCPVCHEVKAREDFPRHIDKRTPCIACQQGKSGNQHPAEGASPAQEQVHVFRRGFKTPREKPTRDTN